METLFKCGFLICFESYLWNNWWSTLSSLSVPTSLAISEHPAGGAMLSWLAKEICEVFEDSKCYKMNNVLSIVIITKTTLRTCACWSGALSYQRNLCICHSFGVWDSVFCDKVTMSSLKTWTIILEFLIYYKLSFIINVCTNIYCRIIFWEI